MRRRGPALVLACLLPVAAAAETDGLQAPHRAYYELTVTNEGGDGATGGRMVLEWQRECAGERQSARMSFEVRLADGTVLAIQQSAWAWENAAHDRYRYVFEGRQDGRLLDSIRGRAWLPADGGPGQAIYETPAGVRHALPLGTQFPLRHGGALLEAAVSGAATHELIVFNGSRIDKVERASAEIEPNERSIEAARLDGLLEGRDSWLVRIRYVASPDKPVGALRRQAFRLYEGGVIGDFLFEEDRLVIRGRLVAVEALAPPDC